MTYGQKIRQVMLIYSCLLYQDLAIISWILILQTTEIVILNQEIQRVLYQEYSSFGEYITTKEIQAIVLLSPTQLEMLTDSLGSLPEDITMARLKIFQSQII